MNCDTVNLRTTRSQKQKPNSKKGKNNDLKESFEKAKVQFWLSYFISFKLSNVFKFFYVFNKIFFIFQIQYPIQGVTVVT